MLESWLQSAVGIVWNYPVVGLCLFGGIYFTLRLAFIQIRCFPHALALISGKYDNPNEPGTITHFQALSAALSGTIGLGNIAGVAIAIAMGGPGAVFWMWVIAFFGMATKYAECSLGTIFREQDPETGKFHGGPMYYITKGLGPQWKPMAVFFAICCAIGSLGFANMFQANQVAAALSRYYHVPDWMTGLALALVVGVTIIGGIKRIGQVAGKIVPLMCVIYLGAAFYIMLTNLELIPLAHQLIISDAFSGNAAAGGVIGTVVMIGVRRAVFSNEAGLGSAPIAHAAVKTSQPIREGVVASVGPFIDTIVVCTATAMAIIISGNFGSEMYEESSTLGFNGETGGDFVLTGDWNAKSEGIPENTSPFQRLRTDGAALTFDSGRLGGSAITAPIPVRTVGVANGNAGRNLKDSRIQVSDGLRFSCVHNGGDHGVQLLNRDGVEIASLNVGPEGDTAMGADPKTGADIPMFTINGCGETGVWHSHVITFAPAFKKMVKDSETSLGALHLRFSAEPRGASWAVDRFQPVKELTGVELTTVSFDKYLNGWAGILISIGVVLFCYSTMITWSYYGQTALVYVFGERVVMPYKLLFVVTAFVGSVTNLSLVLAFSDLMSGLMVIPNTIAILMLSPVVIGQSQEYFRRLRAGEFEPSHVTT